MSYSYPSHLFLYHSVSLIFLSCIKPLNELESIFKLFKEMNGRIFVLVFFFWALLTIITPTLVIWSASAKPSLGSPGDERDFGVKVRRLMMGHPQSYHWIKVASAPAPTPMASSKPITGEGLHYELMSAIEKIIEV